jgi:hypothetical protein
MHLRLRPLLFATGALLFTTANAFAQFIELVTEAPVTLQVTLTTTTTTTTATARTTTPTVSKLGPNLVLAELLRATGQIPADSTDVTGWKLVAVNYAPADLAYVNGEFKLYLVKGDTRVLVPASKFSASAFGAVEKYKERHLGRYVLNSSGTVTNHVVYDYLPAFTVTPTGNPVPPAVRYTLTDSTTDGFASIAYATKNSSNGYEVSFYAISSLRATNRGSFQATTQVGEGPSSTGQGLITLTLDVGVAKLVPASLYPAVSTFPGVAANL